MAHRALLEVADAPGGTALGRPYKGHATADILLFMSSLRMAPWDPRTPPPLRAALERAEMKHIFTAGRKRER